MPNGDLVAGGNFTAARGVAAVFVARWAGAAWSPLGAGLTGFFVGGVRVLTTLPNGDVVAGGLFTTVGGTASNIARWNGASWSPMGMGPGTVGIVAALTTLPNGDLVAGGQFTSAGGVAVNKHRALEWHGVVAARRRSDRRQQHPGLRPERASERRPRGGRHAPPDVEMKMGDAMTMTTRALAKQVEPRAPKAAPKAETPATGK